MAGVESWREFARRLEAAGHVVSHTTVTKYGDDPTSQPRAGFLAAVCEEFDVSPEWLLTGEGEMRWARGNRRAMARAVIAEWLESRLAEVVDVERAPSLGLRSPREEDGSNNGAAMPEVGS